MIYQELVELVRHSIQAGGGPSAMMPISSMDQADSFATTPKNAKDSSPGVIVALKRIQVGCGRSYGNSTVAGSCSFVCGCRCYWLLPVLC
jgi:hypothetical protein